MPTDNGVEYLDDIDPTEYDSYWGDDEIAFDEEYEEAQGANGHLYRYLKDSPYYRATHSDNCACKTDPERFW